MRVRYTPRANSDLHELHSYISRQSPAAATRVCDRIRSVASRLSEEPRRGREVEQRPGVRQIAVVHYPYAIYFAIENGEVVIVHIRHTARQTPKADEL